MAGISNVGNLSNNNSKVTKKLSFDVGESFTAQIVDGDSEKGEVTLRTADGWKFSAKIENFSNIDHYGTSGKFVVTGIEDGKVKIKLVDIQDENSNQGKSDINELLKQLGLSSTKENIELLNSLIKHNMPLTKENIANMKNLIEFNEKTLQTDEKIDEFIAKYIENRGISAEGNEGDIVKEALKDFLGNLKSLSSEDIITFLENGIDLTGKNIESFNKIFKSSDSLYDELKNISSQLKGSEEEIKTPSQEVKQAVKEDIPTNEGILEAIKKHNKSVSEGSGAKEGLEELQSKEIIKEPTESIINLLKESGKDISKLNKGNLESNINLLKNLGETLEKVLNENSSLPNSKVNVNTEVAKFITEKFDAISENNTKEIVKEFIKDAVPAAYVDDASAEEIVKLTDDLKSQKAEDNSNKNNISQNTKDNIAPKNIINDNVKEDVISNKLNKENVEKLIKNILSGDNKAVDSSAENVKQQINSRIEDMKSFVRQIVNAGDNVSDVNLAQRVAEIIKNNINDFKVFNSVSNQYYYMDIPVNNKNNDYQCKLIVKDDRRSGKRIDSKNVKIITSVKTVNMGVVDAYVKIFEDNLNVKIKCEEKWVSTFNKSRNLVVNKILGKGYNVKMSVEKKQKDEVVNIVKCRSFFNDNNDYYKIDIRV